MKLLRLMLLWLALFASPLHAATYEYVIASDADDGNEIRPAGTWTARIDEGFTAGERMYVAKDTNPSPTVIAAVRFTPSGSPCPQGATLVSATLHTVIAGSQSIDAAQSVITIYGDDVDASPALSVTHMPGVGWTSTSATVTVSSLADGARDIVITTVAQELVSRGGWTGAALSLALDSSLNGSDAFWEVYFADLDADTTPLTLTIVTADAGGLLLRRRRN